MLFQAEWFGCNLEDYWKDKDRRLGADAPELKRAKFKGFVW